MAAAEMVGWSLERYVLTMDEIEVREQRCVQVEVSGGGLGRRGVDVAFRHGVEAGNWVRLDRPVSGIDRGLLA